MSRVMFTDVAEPEIGFVLNAADTFTKKKDPVAADFMVFVTERVQKTIAAYAQLSVSERIKGLDEVLEAGKRVAVTMNLNDFSTLTYLAALGAARSETVMVAMDEAKKMDTPFDLDP